MAEARITLKVDGNSVTVHPVFGDDIKIKFSKEKDQVFQRTTVEGTVKFVREDFDLIASCSHNSTLQIGVYNGSTLLGTSDFIKSDCELDYDDRVCTIKITTKDRYEDFLAKYDNKYNLPKLAPAITPLTLHKRPVLQFYFLHDKKITNVFGNMSFEADARGGSEDLTANEVQTKGFRLLGTLKAIDIPSSPSSLSTVAGRYVSQSGTSGIGARLYREDNSYYLEFAYSSDHAAYYWQLYNSGGTAYYNGGYVYVTAQASDTVTEFDCGIKLGANYGSATQIAITTTHNRILYARILSDFAGEVTGESKTAINTISDDVAEDNHNYLYAWTVNTLDLISRMHVSDTVQSEPTEWGINGDEEYFVRPTPSATENAMYPVGWSLWIPFSFWFESSPSLDATMRGYYDTTYVLRDAYAIHDSINLLLQAMDVPYDFQANSPYSEFLYGYSFGLIDTIPSPKMRSNYIYIAPITNVKKTRYEQPARKGDITLKQILDMFKKVYQCYWYLDDVGRLCIEHISYFKNNQTYGLYTPTPLVDLTTMKDMPNGKMWSFDTSTVKFDRKNCPSRYEFEWGNDCTEQFNGYAIDILDKPAEGTGKESNAVTNFTADIDYTVIYPSGVSDDIYAIVEANKSTGEVQIIDVTLLSGNPVYSMQNGYLSFLFAEQNYWPYDLGGWDARVEGQRLPVYAVRHLIEQSVGVPLEGQNATLPHTLSAVKTELGVGLLKGASVNINTLYSNTDLTMQAEKDDYKNNLRLYVALYSHGNYAIFMQNTSNTVVDVRYTYQGGSVQTCTIWGGSNYVVASGSQSSLDVNNVVILTAKQTSSYNVCIGDVIKCYGSRMTASIDQSSPTDIIATFNGNNYSGNDFAYIKVHVIKPCSVKITPSSENNYDFGYVATRPCATKAQVTSPGTGIVYASGTTVKTGSLTAGQDVYIGYLKDSAVSGNDKVVIEISQN